MILGYLIEKEFKQMMRNIILPVVFVVLPVVMINVMARTATQEVKNLSITIVDNDHSSWSQRLVHKLDASAYFSIVDVADTYTRALQGVESGNSDFIIEIEQDFERQLVSTGEARVQISANAVNGVKAGLGTSYLTQIIADYAAQLRAEMGLDAYGTRLERYGVAPRFLYNTTLDYKRYMVPGLISMLLILIVGFLPALNIVGEKEKGTIEQINVTPVSRSQFILSKLIPYWIVGLLILGYAMLLARLIYGQAPAGSVALIFAFATVFVLLVSSLGLVVSNYSDTAQQAALVMFFFLIIFILLSGLLTPISSMPQWAQVVTMANPLRYFIDAMRSIYLKGSAFADLATDFYALAAYAAVTWIWAILSYRKQS